jgi:hypothetical protein
VPQLVKRAHIHVVTSAFRPIPLSWAILPNLQLVVSVDGLQPEHDVRRKPATYERILRNIQGHHIAVHCTITSAMMKRGGYITEFVGFWAANPAVEKIWMSIFTPQRNAANIENLAMIEGEGRQLAQPRPRSLGRVGAGRELGTMRRDERIVGDSDDPFPWIAPRVAE